MRQAILEVAWLRGRSAHAIQWLTALGMSVALSMLILGGAVLLELRADAWHQAEQASSNLVLALTRDIARNITLYDLSLKGAIDAMARPDINRISPETRQMALFDRAASAEYLGSLVVLDENGDIIEESTAIEPHKFNFADREHFWIHQQRADVGLFISRPYQSRLRGGEASIALSRRISRPDGTFGGVVVGTLRLAYFQDLFGKLDLGSAGSVTLLRSDGRVIMRRPFRKSDVDNDLSNTPTFRRYAEAQSGTLVGIATLDGVNRLYTFRHLGNLPLVLSVAVAVDDIYAAWWRKALGIGVVLIGLCSATVALCILFRREILRRLAAESKLIDAARQLSVLAATDGLTGLANRRAFEERLAEEWKRAARAETPIALLMLDADFFKSFNDRYGHPEGDRVLRLIASRIADCVLRPADMGARYGGEEFVALLPETDLPGACAVAERILAAVAALEIPHAGSPGGTVTVSIGVAVAHPFSGIPPASLVAQADAALYDAKHAGRNRINVGVAEAALPMTWKPRIQDQIEVT